MWIYKDFSRPDMYRDTFLKVSTPVDNPWYNKRVRRELELRTNRNPVIFRLPSEITAKIFKLAQIHNANFDVAPERWCWLTITHVCKLWREIALGAQELWTYLDIRKLSGLEQTEAYLARSGTSEIVVRYRGSGGVSDSDSFRSLVSALGQMDRIRELWVWEVPRLNSEDLEVLKIALYRSAAPVLRKFVFRNDSLNEVDARALIQGQVGSLKELCLEVNSPSWNDVPIMRNLRYLNIDTRQNALDLQTALSIFSENVNVETAFMKSLKGASYRGGSRTPIRLPYLKDLIITADYYVLCQLFRNIVTPNLMGWTITCTAYPVDLNLTSNPKDILPQECANTTCKSLRLTISPLYVSLTADNHSVDNKEWDNDAYPPRRTLVCSWKENEEAVFDIDIVDKLGHICDLLKGGFWCSAEELTVEIQVDGSEMQDPLVMDDLEWHPWLRLLTLFPALKELSVLRVDSVNRSFVEGSYCGLLGALSCTRVDDSLNSVLINPQLRDLRIVQLDLGVGLPYLSEALKTRAVHGGRICKLWLDEPLRVTELALHILDQRELVTRIEIDGVSFT